MTTPRIVRCTIEMEMREFEHFNRFRRDDISDDEAIERAKVSFLAGLTPTDVSEIVHLWDYVQAKIVEDVS